MSEVFDVAIKALEDGWTQQGTLQDGAGNVCLNMALAIGLGITGQETNDDIYQIVDNSLAGQLVADVILEQHPEFKWWTGKGTSVMNYMFNDHPGTTFNDVAVVLEKANAKMEERV